MAIKDSPVKGTLGALDAVTDSVSAAQGGVVLLTAAGTFVGTVTAQIMDPFGEWVTVTDTDQQLTTEGFKVVDTGLPCRVRGIMAAYTSGAADVTLRAR